MDALPTLLTALALLLGLAGVWGQSFAGRLSLFALQSAALAALAASVGFLAHQPALFVVALALAVIKVWLVPRVLRRIGAGLPARPTAPKRSAALSLLAACAVGLMAYVLVLPVARAGGRPMAGAIALAFAIVLIGLHACVTGRTALGHALGFLGLENGIFAVAVLTTYELPALVAAGLLLDAFVVALVGEGVGVDIGRERDARAADRHGKPRG